MIDWLSWPLAQHVDTWVIALLKGLAAVQKFTILIDVTLLKIELVSRSRWAHWSAYNSEYVPSFGFVLNRFWGQSQWDRDSHLKLVCSFQTVFIHFSCFSVLVSVGLMMFVFHLLVFRDSLTMEPRLTSNSQSSCLNHTNRKAPCLAPNAKCQTSSTTPHLTALRLCILCC